MLAGSATGAIGGTGSGVAQVQNNSTTETETEVETTLAPESTTANRSTTKQPAETGRSTAKETTRSSTMDEATSTTAATETTVPTRTSTAVTQESNRTTAETSEPATESEERTTEETETTTTTVSPTTTPENETVQNESALPPGSAPNVQIEVYHSSAHPEQVRFWITGRLPQDTESFRISFYKPQSSGSESGVVYSEGFDVSSSGYARWNGTARIPTLIYAIDLADYRSAQQRAVDYAGTSDWILAPTPEMTIDWSTDALGYESTEPLQKSTSENVTVDALSQGVIGQRLTYLGEYEEYALTDNSQRLRLIVPQEANLGPTSREILHSVALASGQLHVGSRDSEVLMVAGPEPIRSGGYAFPKRDEFVVGDEGGILIDGPALNTLENVWLHEYIHTRQSFERGLYSDNLGPKTEWFTEASAEYYAALLTYKQQRTDNEEALEHLKPGRYRDAVLADRSTWSDSEISPEPYEKGSAVLYALD